jgi:AcrR family transcriptional regulator
VARPVKRTYDNAARQARSDDTRNRILDAARHLLTTRGYRATTLAEVAHDADVHVDTIYQLLGRKPALLQELIERAISGVDRPVDPQDRGYVHAMQAEPDPARKLAIYAGAVRQIQTRLAPLLVALRDAATTDADANHVWKKISDRRARNMRDLVRALGPQGTLRPALSVDEAADVIWATAGAEFFLLLTVERGWSLDTYEQWLADTWQRLLLAN